MTKEQELLYALNRSVEVIKQWHGAEVFDIYYSHAPEMKPIRDALASYAGSAEGEKERFKRFCFICKEDQKITPTGFCDECGFDVKRWEAGLLKDHESHERYPGESDNNLKDLIIYGIEEGVAEWEQRAKDAEAQVEKLKAKVRELGRVQIEALKAIHYKCREYLDVQDYWAFIRYVEPIIAVGDPNELKMLQVVTKSLKDQSALKDTISTINEKMEAWEASGKQPEKKDPWIPAKGC